MELIYRLATEKDNDNIRKLWEIIFPEDSSAYLDFYFKYVRPYNKVIVVYDGDKPVSMLHLNPYDVHCHDNIEKVYYVVAVATLADYRRQGIMREMLNMAESIALQEGIRYLILLPADERYYRPFGYTFVSCQYNTTIDTAAYSLSGSNDKAVLKKLAEDNLSKKVFISLFTDDASFAAAPFRAVHTNYLAERIYEEVRAEGGKIIEVKGNLILYYDMGQKVEVRKIYWSLNNDIEEFINTLMIIKDVLLYISQGRLMVIHETNEAILADCFTYYKKNIYDYRPYMMIKNLDNQSNSADIKIEAIGFDELV